MTNNVIIYNSLEMYVSDQQKAPARVVIINNIIIYDNFESFN